MHKIMRTTTMQHTEVIWGTVVWAHVLLQSVNYTTPTTAAMRAISCQVGAQEQ